MRDPRRRASSAGSRRAASSGSASRYTAGEWDSDDLVALLELLLRNAEAAAARHAGWRALLDRAPAARTAATAPAARGGTSHYHYDLGNDLFRLFLDETMTYSCAVFERAGRAARGRPASQATGWSASSSGSGPDDRVLEIGCGWGSFALVAAGEYGAQRHRADALRRRRRRSRASGRRGRALDGSASSSRTTAPTRARYTKVASIEMIEAIGERAVPDVLRGDRPAARAGRPSPASRRSSSRTSATSRYRSAPDWIERYVFPGCLIPSLSALDAGVTRARGLTVRERGRDRRAATRRRCAAGGERFLTPASTRCARSATTSRFERTWDFYLAFCEAAFRTGALRDAQLVARAAERGARVILYRLLDAIGFRAVREGPLPHRAHRRRADSRDGAVHPRREPRVARRPVRPRHGHDAEDPLHGEGRALAKPAARPGHGRVRHLPGRAGHRRRTGAAGAAGAPRRGRAPRDLPAGNLSSSPSGPTTAAQPGSRSRRACRSCRSAWSERARALRGRVGLPNRVLVGQPIEVAPEPTVAAARALTARVERRLELGCPRRAEHAWYAHEHAMRVILIGWAAPRQSSPRSTSTSAGPATPRCRRRLGREPRRSSPRYAALGPGELEHRILIARLAGLENLRIA